MTARITGHQQHRRLKAYFLIQPLLAAGMMMLASYPASAVELLASLDPAQTQAGNAHRPILRPLLYGINENDLEMAKNRSSIRYSDRWEMVSERSRYVRHRLVESLRAKHVPDALQVIPIVESTYNPYALSRSGAVGLWQLMPKTAMSLGISPDRKIDGRRSVEKSTTVAVQYLIDLYDRFDNWPLAIAAYNLGPNAVAARLRKEPWDIGNPLEKLPVPEETRDYVIHIIGLVALLEEGALAFPDPIKTLPVNLQPPVDLHLLAGLSGMEKDEIFHFNPSLNQAQYLSRPVTIHVPESLHAQVQESAAKAGPKFVYATVKKGDSLWSIAKTHSCSVESLKQLNRGSSKVLRIGQKLKVPANQLARASANINPLLNSDRRIRYRVRSGDSLWRIASRFGTTVKAITKINNLSSKSIIRAGDTLWVLARIRPG
ncbi:lytic transglycosylase domain-containing protein [Mariprofundus ferrinatatus]|nr:lytic transglycosylase domain-containing protein [Mariprofundus ferrinatatus]